MTALDVQIKKLRDTALVNIRDAACRMKEEATDVKATLTDIDDWLERLQQIAEEVVYNLLHLWDIFCKNEIQRYVLLKH